MYLRNGLGASGAFLQYLAGSVGSGAHQALFRAAGWSGHFSASETDAESPLYIVDSAFITWASQQPWNSLEEVEAYVRALNAPPAPPPASAPAPAPVYSAPVPIYHAAPAPAPAPIYSAAPAPPPSQPVAAPIPGYSSTVEYSPPDATGSNFYAGHGVGADVQGGAAPKSGGMLAILAAAALLLMGS